MILLQRAIKPALTLSTLLALWLVATTAAAERPRIVITRIQLEQALSDRERQGLMQVDLIQVLREALLDSRSFTVLTRDNASVQSIVEEMNLGDSPLAADGAESPGGLEVASYFLQPTVKQFRLTTRYEPMEMLPDVYERHDSADLEIAVLVFDGSGQTLFEERVSRSRSFAPVEADETARRRNAPRHLADVKAETRDMLRSIVDAMVTRINPITVIDVQQRAFIIDRGRNNGFDESTRFWVFAPSRTVRHPTTGEDIVVPGDRVGMAKISKLYEDVAEATLVHGDPGQVEAGMTLRIATE